jgi:hypothetical protein
VARAFAVTPFRDADPEECLLERRARRGKVGALVVAGLEGTFRLAARLLGFLEVDLAGHVGCRKPPTMANDSSLPPLRMRSSPTPSIDTSGAWWGSTPSSPSEPGSWTESTSSE